MRSATTAVFLVLFTPACGRAVSVTEKGTEAVLLPRPPRPEPALAIGPGGAGGSTNGTSGGAPYTGSGPAGCSFGVTGAVLAWVDEPEAWAWMWPDGWFSCSGSAAGTNHSLSAQLGPLHGPGQYVTVGQDRYERSWCTKDATACEHEDFTSATLSTVCVFEMSVAPTGGKLGDPIAGTFSCSELVEEADPTREVTLYAGSVWGVLSRPPD